MGVGKNKRISKPKKSRVIKPKKFSTMFGKAEGFVILGRSPFGTKAKKITVNQTASAGAVEDRRHILHYDEVLKPTIERVVTALYRKDGFDQGRVAARVRSALQKSDVQRLPKSDDKLMERLVTEINSAQDNLIPDRADTNKAIEVVRGYLRNYQKALSTEQFADDALTANHTRMAAYKKLAHDSFPLDASGGEITDERNRIHREILGFVDGCDSPSQLWDLLHGLVHSVTFDFSPKITRDATVKALAWQKTMRLNEDADPDQQLDDMMSLLT